MVVVVLLYLVLLLSFGDILIPFIEISASAFGFEEVVVSGGVCENGEREDK